jgi:hypothetical protein
MRTRGAEGGWPYSLTSSDKSAIAIIIPGLRNVAMNVRPPEEYNHEQANDL